MNRAVLLLAYGGPAQLADVPAYLADIRGGRPTPPALVEEFTERYRLIGGRSPLLDITQSLATRLQQQLDLPVYIGMRHWHPYIKETVAQMAALGVAHATVICLAPHYSRMSIGAYRQRLDEATAAAGTHMAIDFVDSWHLQPEYLAGLAARVRQTLTRFAEPDRVKVVFTAHSLPAAIIEQGDPYDAQVRATAATVAEMLRLSADRWMLAYQSAARRSERWLEPAVEEVVRTQAEAGVRDMLVAPVGFVMDHVEVLYDLDIELQQVAAEAGAHVERTPMLNDGPDLVDALASIVRARSGADSLEQADLHE
jgi:protoporphyrin/coproporphyrin ferrochelatase